jgi:hypothetical protein
MDSEKGGKEKYSKEKYFKDISKDISKDKSYNDEKIIRKKEEKRKKGNERSQKLQELKQKRNLQSKEQKCVADIVDIVRTIFPILETNILLRKYLNLNQLIKLEMWSGFKEVKEKYSGNNEEFIQVIKVLINKIQSVLYPTLPEMNDVNEIYELNKEKCNEILLLYIKA